MERTEFVAVLTPLVLGRRVDFDQPTWGAYYRALKDIPAQWLIAAVDVALKADRAGIETTGQLRTLADRALAAAQAQLTPGACDVCHGARWIEVPDAAGVMRAQRCTCWDDYRTRVAALGAVQTVALEAGEPFDARLAQMGSDR